MIIFKIRRPDGLFSRGGSYLSDRSFTKTGKIWKRKGDLSLHLASLNQRDIAYYKSVGAEVVEYELVETQMSSISLSGYLDRLQTAKQEREAERQRYREASAKAAREKQYIMLKQEFELDKNKP